MSLDLLPLKIDVQTPKILKKAISANRALAKLNGIAYIIPNTAILINSLMLQEAKDSSEIENIITTHDELYRADVYAKDISKETKEVKDYKKALLKGIDFISSEGLLLKKHIVKIQSILESNNAGIRKQSGTTLKSLKTGKTIYTPPQEYEIIQNLLDNLECYINEPNQIDGLINMAIIHYQFESIHPFYDGNGRSGRILNILYLILQNLLEFPVLYLSRYIILHKVEYYKLLQNVREKNEWEEWILYMLKAVESTSNETIKLTKDIDKLMSKTQNKIINKLPKIYSKDLVEALFIHPYTKIDFLVQRLQITRQTASKYLTKLEEIDILKAKQIKNSKFYVNTKLSQIMQYEMQSST